MKSLGSDGQGPVNRGGECTVEPLTSSPGHFFFGFHDISAWNPRGDRIACLKVDSINAPPDGQQQAVAGYLNEGDGNFVPLIETTAFNYPQGARQLWGPDNEMWVNVRLGDHWGATKYVDSGSRAITVDQPLYALADDGKTGWGVNFSRLNRLMGYGYIGLADLTAEEVAPTDDGIHEVDLITGRSRLLVSIREVAEAAGGRVKRGHHYLTHLVLSPSNHRILFLHRYWLPDGGLHHRLFSVARDGSGLSCHAEGFLSHFDWINDDQVLIWGRAGASIDKYRRHPLLQIPGVGPLAKFAKSMIKKTVSEHEAFRMSFLKVDLKSNLATSYWPDFLQKDGHPMFCPGQRDWLIIDTYPNQQGIRDLMLFNVVTGQRVDLGNYRKAEMPVDTSGLERAFQHVDPALVGSLGTENIAFWRSGIHCDLHPRWNRNGHSACFDSIHEGSRQMYRVNIGPEIGEE